MNRNRSIRKKKVVFLQIPHLDNDARAMVENVPLAADYLTWGAVRNGLGRLFLFHPLARSADLLDDRHLVEAILRQKPDVLAVTLYVWNVERSLRVLKCIRRELPNCRILAGGPEVSKDHPFLFRHLLLDAAVMGEGELVFPELLQHFFCGGRLPFYRNVAWRKSRGYVWGTEVPPTAPLRDLLPPPGRHVFVPGPHGIVYLETSRGCPLRCMFCCYNQRRRGVSFIGPEDVRERIQKWRLLGVTEFRIVDPTFNSNPQFEAILEGIAELNSSRTLRFFAEVRAETITERQAALLKKANFAALEVGVQSRDASVLSRIRRPTNLLHLGRGIRLLSGRKIHLTVDIMNGLPGQTLDDLRRSLAWAARVQPGRLQFLPTLLIPGTELRNSGESLGLQAQARPPYRVLRTATLSEADMRKAEDMASRFTGHSADCLTERFVGRTLPDLFPEQVRVAAPFESKIPGTASRRALLFGGKGLYGWRESICSYMRRAMEQEPNMLWQFVLEPESEEPLELLEEMAEEIRKMPDHFLDRLTHSAQGDLLVARRVFIQLPAKQTFDRAWCVEAEDLLRQIFH